MDVTKITQETVKYAVATVTSKVVSDFATKHTNFNEITIKIGSFAVGASVADALKPRTDAIVNKTLSKIKVKRSKNIEEPTAE
jgi:hypothetical protein